MSIADKLLTAANNTPAVVEAVNGAKTTVSGSSVRADDVLDVAHPLEVQLKSKNLIDLSVITDNYNISEVYRYEDGVLCHKGNTTGAGGQKDDRSGAASLKELCPGIVVGQTYTISATTTDENKQYVYLSGNYNKSWVFGAALTITEAMLTDKVLWYSSGGGVEVFISDIQVEQGSVATEYVPHDTDAAGGEVTAYGKNLVDISVIGYDEATKYVQYIAEDNTILIQGSRTPTTGLGCGKTLRELAPGLQVGQTCFLQGTSSLSNRNYIYLQGYNSSWFFGRSLIITDIILDSKVFFYTDVGVDAVVSNVQIELGAAATDYEDYKAPQTATADENGKVSGLLPVAPTMTLVSGHTVECTYFPTSAAETYGKYQQLRQKQIELRDNIKEELRNV